MRSTVLVAAAGLLVSSIACQKMKPVPLTAPDAPLSPVQKTGVLPACNTGHGTNGSSRWVPTGQLEGSDGYELSGSADTETGAFCADLPAGYGRKVTTAYAEADVKEGRVRVYVAPKVDKAVYTQSDIASAGYSYADATPGHPVKIRGELISCGGNAGFIFETVEPVKGLRWRIWN